MVEVEVTDAELEVVVSSSHSSSVEAVVELDVAVALVRLVALVMEMVGDVVTLAEDDEVM